MMNVRDDADHRSFFLVAKREALANRIAQLSGDSFAVAEVQRVGERLFYEQRPAHGDNYKLFVREGGKDRLLIDPTAISTTGVGHFSLDWWSATS